ncbi:MAG: metalloprotease TldD [Candidatus Eremiobacteraeota bacterium]|nr:metalloprotease TldD [Candidatus Eremiobacteraeota bacterium]
MSAHGLDPALLRATLDAALERGGIYADVFVEHRISQSVRLQDSKIHEAIVSVTSGAGIRVIEGERQGYAFTDILSESALVEAARVASLIARDGARTRSADLREQAVSPRYRVDAQAEERGLGDLDTYVAFLDRIDRAGRAYDSRVESVNGAMNGEVQHVQIATSDGNMLRDTRPMIVLSAQIVARDGVRGFASYADGGRTSLAFYDKKTPESIALEAARIAVMNAEAREAPAGEMPVVVGAGSGGVLLHEAVGHGLEGDFNREGTSLYSGRIGERVASELVTIFDDGDIDSERGSLSIDDEGTPGQHKVLIERGVLRSYMLDRLNGRLMGGGSTGSGRRQNFRYLPQPRMCNTYMPPGESSLDEIIKSVDRGVYAKSFAGGQVEISRGDFVFMISEGYLIEDGKITAPIRGASLIGNGPAIMEKVVAVGSDARLANGQYTCGKYGQMVPVGVGLPTVKISSLTVGGSALG